MTDAATRARELLDKATPGPWWVLNEYTEPHQDGDEWHIYGRVGNSIRRVVDNTEDQMTWQDAELIAAAPTLLAELADEVDRLREESDEYAAMMDRLGELLAGVANALNGPPPELTSWGYHDLPKKAADAMAEVERLRAQPTITDEMVEQAAEVICDVFDRHGHNGVECRPDCGMDLYSMEAARAALEAALGVAS